MNIVRNDPWHNVNVFDQFNAELDAWLRNRPMGRITEGDDSNVVTSRWAPAVDIKEEAHQFVLFADIPGVDPNAIEITMDNNVLTIKGERNHEAEQTPNSYKRVERLQGTFYRRFSLPDSADADNIGAKNEHGVLIISIPKKQKAQPRRINVAA